MEDKRGNNSGWLLGADAPPRKRTNPATPGSPLLGPGVTALRKNVKYPHICCGAHPGTPVSKGILKKKQQGRFSPSRKNYSRFPLGQKGERWAENKENSEGLVAVGTKTSEEQGTSRSGLKGTRKAEVTKLHMEIREFIPEKARPAKEVGV